MEKHCQPMSYVFIDNSIKDEHLYNSSIFLKNLFKVSVNVTHPIFFKNFSILNNIFNIETRSQTEKPEISSTADIVKLLLADLTTYYGLDTAEIQLYKDYLKESCFEELIRKIANIFELNWGLINTFNAAIQNKTITNLFLFHKACSVYMASPLNRIKYFYSIHYVNNEEVKTMLDNIYKKGTLVINSIPVLYSCKDYLLSQLDNNKDNSDLSKVLCLFHFEGNRFSHFHYTTINDYLVYLDHSLLFKVTKLIKKTDNIYHIYLSFASCGPFGRKYSSDLSDLRNLSCYPFNNYMSKINYSIIGQYNNKQPLKQNYPKFYRNIKIVKLHFIYLSNDSEVKHFVKQLKRVNNIESLLLQNNNLTFSGFSMIVDYVRGNKNLKDFVCSENQINDKCVEYLSSWLGGKGIINLKKLSLWHNNITDKGVVILFNALKGNLTINDLNLNANSIEGIDELVGLVEVNRSLSLITLIRKLAFRNMDALMEKLESMDNGVIVRI